MMKLENKTNIKEGTQINDIKIVLSNIQELDKEIIKSIKSSDEHLTTELILFVENDFKSYQRLMIYKKSFPAKSSKSPKTYQILAPIIAIGTTSIKNVSYIRGSFPSFFAWYRAHKKAKIAPVKINIAYHLISNPHRRIATSLDGRNSIA